MQVQLLNYSDKCFQSLISNLLNVGDGCSIESVHKLRLSIKRLRTLFKILDYSDSATKKTKLQKRIDSLFLYSGYLRDIHVQIDLIRIYRDQIEEVVDTFVSSLINEEKEIKKRYEKEKVKINPFEIVLLNQRLDNTIEELSDSMIENYLRTKIEEQFLLMSRRIDENLDENNLHRIRIMLKELIYTLSIIKKEKIKLKYSQSFVTSLNNLQQKLGRWHDLKVLFDRAIKANNLKIELVELLKFIEVDKNIIQNEVVDDLMKLKLVLL